MDAADVLAAADHCERFLLMVVEDDWSGRIPDMDWTVAQAIGHAAEAPLWYAIDLSAGGAEVNTVELSVKPDSPQADLIATLALGVRVLTGVLAASSPSSRGLHGWGMADPSGYAAMACDELLIHTDDAARGLGRVFEPESALCAQVLARLFPDAPTDVSPWDGLRWANGRIALPGLPRRQTWRWYCAPLDEQQR